jgi:hypothetical protein
MVAPPILADHSVVLPISLAHLPSILSTTPPSNNNNDDNNNNNNNNNDDDDDDDDKSWFGSTVLCWRVGECRS